MRAVFGASRCRVVSYRDRDENSEIHVLHSTEVPEQGLISFCTIGLSDHADDGYAVEPPLGVEILAVSDRPEFAEVVSTAAFCVINSGYRARLGGAFPGVVRLHYPDTSVPNLHFVAPYLWDDEALRAHVYGEKTVAWLQALPITDAETAYLVEYGADALGAAFARRDPDFVDLRRASVV